MSSTDPSKLSDENTEHTAPLVHGEGGTTADAPLGKEKKTASLPEGMSEMNDRVLSGGSSGVAPGTIEGSGRGEFKGKE